MPLCGKCKTEIEPDKEIFICPDCGTEFHDGCHNLSRGLCPLCTLCGVNPMKQIGRINKAIETSPRALVSTSPAAKGKEWFVAFPALICAYFAWQGFTYGDTVAFAIAVVIAIGAAIWWFKT